MQPQPTQNLRTWSVVRNKCLQFFVFGSGLLGAPLLLALFFWHPANEDALGTIGTLLIAPYFLWQIAAQWLLWADRRADRRVA